MQHAHAGGEHHEGGQEVDELGVAQGVPGALPEVDPRRRRVARGVPPDRRQRYTAEGQSDDGENRPRDLVAQGVIDVPAGHQAQAGPEHGEQENQADYVHPVAGGVGQFRHQRFQGAAGHCAGGEKEFQHQHEVEGVPPAAAFHGQEPEQGGEQGVKGGTEQDERDAASPAAAGAVAPPADEGVGEGVDEPAREDQEAGQHAGVNVEAQQQDVGHPRGAFQQRRRQKEKRPLLAEVADRLQADMVGAEEYLVGPRQPRGRGRRWCRCNHKAQ